MKHIGVFGGSFDPPHLGHKALVEMALASECFDEIWVMPAGVPVHRQLTKSISAERRLAWVTAMFDGMEKIIVKDWEVGSLEPVPSIISMRKIAAMHVLPCWLMGMDAWQGLPNWVAYPEHRKLCNVAVFRRLGIDGHKLNDWQSISDERFRNMHTTGHVCFMDGQLPYISATVLRKKMRLGEDVSDMLDACVAKDIQAAYAKVSDIEENV